MTNKLGISKQMKDILTLFSSIIKFLFSWFERFFIKNKTEIYLIGSNYGTKRSDNATALFNYIKSLGKEVYFIENIPEGNNSLKRGSLKSFIYYFKSEGVFYSHSFSDMLPGMHRAGWIVKFLNGPKKVFIQHGVTFTKRVDKYISSLNSTIDFFIISAGFEGEIIRGMGIPEKKIKLAGFPRYDLLKQNLQPSKKVFLFLSWKSSYGYLKKLKEILDVIEESDYEIKVSLHNMLEKDVDIPKEYLAEDIGKEVREASVLITDDSSIAWDFFYNGREVIFYKSEEEWYLDKKFLQERRVDSKNELKKHLKKIVDNKLENKIPQNLFKYRDKENSKRVFEILNDNSKI